MVGVTVKSGYLSEYTMLRTERDTIGTVVTEMLELQRNGDQQLCLRHLGKCDGHDGNDERSVCENVIC